MTGRTPRRAAFAALCLFALASAFGSAAQAAVVIKKTTIYVNTLPKGCIKTTYSGGTVVWRCGTLYYMPYKGRYVRVYIQ